LSITATSTVARHEASGSRAVQHPRGDIAHEDINDASVASLTSRLGRFVRR
jgi:hypothetical protein